MRIPDYWAGILWCVQDGSFCTDWCNCCKNTHKLLDWVVDEKDRCDHNKPFIYLLVLFDK